MLKWFKLAAVTTAFAFGAMMTGCTEDNPLDPDPQINVELDQISNDIQAGAGMRITGTIECDVAIDSWTWDIETDAGGEVDTNKVKISRPLPNVVGETKIELMDLAIPVNIVTTAAACNGTYKAVVTVNAGDASTTERVTFTVTGGVDCDGSMGTPLTESSLGPIGAQNANSGSSVDLDGGSVYTLALARNNSTNVDFLYLSADGETVQKIFTPEHSVASNYTIFTAASDLAETSFMKVTQSYDEINTAEDLQAVWDSGTPDATSLTANLNDVFIVMTSEDKLVLFQITSVNGSGGGAEINIKYAK